MKEVTLVWETVENFLLALFCVLCALHYTKTSNQESHRFTFNLWFTIFNSIVPPREWILKICLSFDYNTAFQIDVHSYLKNLSPRFTLRLVLYGTILHSESIGNCVGIILLLYFMNNQHWHWRIITSSTKPIVNLNFSDSVFKLELRIGIVIKEGIQMLHLKVIHALFKRQNCEERPSTFFKVIHRWWTFLFIIQKLK